MKKKKKELLVSEGLYVSRDDLMDFDKVEFESVEEPKKIGVYDRDYIDEMITYAIADLKRGECPKKVINDLYDVFFEEFGNLSMDKFYLHNHLLQGVLSSSVSHLYSEVRDLSWTRLGGE